MRRVYLSGPMAGLPEHGFPAFHDAAKRLRAAGFEVVSPAELPQGNCKVWADYLARDIPHMLTCDAVVTLGFWYGSQGARLEVHIMAALGRRVVSMVEIEDAMRRGVLANELA